MLGIFYLINNFTRYIMTILPWESPEKICNNIHSISRVSYTKLIWNIQDCNLTLHSVWWNYIAMFCLSTGIKTVHIDIFEAAKGGHVKRMREILGADPSQANLVDDDGATPLMFSSMKGHVEITELLIGAGANINAQDTISGWTALMQAVYYG